MKKKLIIIVLLLSLFFIPNKVEAYSTKLYLFYKDSCPHCANEKAYLNSIKDNYKDLEIILYEIENDSNNYSLMEDVKTSLNNESNYIPYTVIGTNTIVGYSEYANTKIKNIIEACIENGCIDLVSEVNKRKTFISSSEIDKMKKDLADQLNTNVVEDNNPIKDIPLLGEINVKKASIPLIGIILGFIDGFNPCAMWILIFLINMLFGMKNRKRMWILGFTFLFISALVYFLSMLGISLILSLTQINMIRNLIAFVAIIAGIVNLNNYNKTKNVSGCTVIDDSKRKKMFSKIKKFTGEKNFFLAILGVIALAISVNLVELACSLGFPVVYTEVLTINNINEITKTFYLILYVLFYMLDDIIVFTLAMITLKITGVSNKYNKYSHLIGGIIMIIMGILLIFKPGWIMFNF